MKKLTIVLSVFVLALSFTAPVMAQTGPAPQLDYTGFVKCDGVIAKNPNGTIRAGEEKRNVECDFKALMDTINKTINWIFLISIPFATVLFSYAGILYMTGVPGKRSQANKIFTSVGTGFIIMISAWFIVRTVVGWFVEEKTGATIFLDKNIAPK